MRPTRPTAGSTWRSTTGSRAAAPPPCGTPHCEPGCASSARPCKLTTRVYVRYLRFERALLHLFLRFLLRKEPRCPTGRGGWGPLLKPGPSLGEPRRRSFLRRNCTSDTEIYIYPVSDPEMFITGSDPEIYLGSSRALRARLCVQCAPP